MTWWLWLIVGFFFGSLYGTLQTYRLTKKRERICR